MNDITLDLVMLAGAISMATLVIASASLVFIGLVGAFNWLRSKRRSDADKYMAQLLKRADAKVKARGRVKAITD
jgi:hypothetical protein